MSALLLFFLYYRFAGTEGKTHTSPKHVEAPYHFELDLDDSGTPDLVIRPSWHKPVRPGSMVAPSPSPLPPSTSHGPGHGLRASNHGKVSLLVSLIDYSIACLLAFVFACLLLCLFFVFFSCSPNRVVLV